MTLVLLRHFQDPCLVGECVELITEYKERPVSIPWHIEAVSCSEARLSLPLWNYKLLQQ